MTLPLVWLRGTETSGVDLVQTVAGSRASEGAVVE